MPNMDISHIQQDVVYLDNIFDSILHIGFHIWIK